MSEPVIPAPARAAVGGLGVALSAASVALPAAYQLPAAAVGFLLASLAGFTAPVPQAVAGKPILQGGALVLAGTLGGMLSESWAAIPEGWPQSAALTALALLGWATGKALPAPSKAPPAALLVLALGLGLTSCATMSPTKAAAVAGHTLAETSATFRRVNAVAVDGCTRAENQLPTPVCKSWADFSAWAFPVLDRLEGAYLAGANPSGPDWERLVTEGAALASEILALAFPAADGGTP